MILGLKGHRMKVAFHLDTHQCGEVQVIAIGGHVDAHTAPRLEEAIGACLDGGISRVVLDLFALSYISSAGLGVLTGTLGTFRERGGDLKLARTPEKVFRVLDLLGFTQLLELFDTPEEAIAAFQAVPSRM
jgi:anti-anti-sigma factor